MEEGKEQVEEIKEIYEERVKQNKLGTGNTKLSCVIEEESVNESVKQRIL